jgi:hypothetical protein
MRGSRRVGSSGLAIALAAPAAAGYTLCGTSLQPNVHPFYVDATLSLNANGTVQDWVGAAILASQEWGALGVSRFRFVFAGLVSPPYPSGVSVLTLGTSSPPCGGPCPSGGLFASCIPGNAVFDVTGAPPPGSFDLQGFATHVFGHALGLAHSSVPGATMYAGTQNALEWRSLEPDDVAGLLAINGGSPANAPVLDYAGLPYTGGIIQVRVLGAVAGPAVVGFDPSPGPVIVPGLGPVALGFSPAFVALAASAPGSSAVAIPGNAVLVGITVHMQAVVSTATGFALSNPYRVVIPY